VNSPMKERSEEPVAPDAGATLISTLKHSDLTEVGAALLEVPLDEVLHPGLFKDVPVLGSMLGLWKTGRSIRDYLFTKKLLAFLQSLSDLPSKSRKAMIERLEEDPSFEGRVGDRVLSLLERLDSSDKATFVGRAFAAYCRGLIDSETLRRLSTAIERVPLSDLRKLKGFRETGDAESITRQEYSAAGLALLHHGMVTVHYRPNEPLCDAMLQYVLY
jgi:hypothetical protein